MINNKNIDEDTFVKGAYDKISNEFKKTRVFTWKWCDNFINQLDKHTTLLDIGCGTGRNMNYKDIYTIGIDISIEQLKECDENTIQGDMTKMPFKNNSIDNIISIAAFHHLATIERRKECLSEMHRILKLGGKILLSVWSFDQPKKTRRIFNSYGDTIVYWREIPRYYYIFIKNEKIDFLERYFKIVNRFWDCGNEIFILEK